MPSGFFLFLCLLFLRLALGFCLRLAGGFLLRLALGFCLRLAGGFLLRFALGFCLRLAGGLFLRLALGFCLCLAGRFLLRLELGFCLRLTGGFLLRLALGFYLRLPGGFFAGLPLGFFLRLSGRFFLRLALSFPHGATRQFFLTPHDAMDLPLPDPALQFLTVDDPPFRYGLIQFGLHRSGRFHAQAPMHFDFPAAQLQFATLLIIGLEPGLILASLAIFILQDFLLFRLELLEFLERALHDAEAELRFRELRHRQTATTHSAGRYR